MIIRTAVYISDPANLMQVIYQITSAYFQDDCADELINDPVMTAILDKDKLQHPSSTLSRFGLLSPRCCHMVSADSQP